MEELAYDTLSEAKELEAAGFSGRQAEAIVGTVSRAAAINEQIAGDLIAITARTDAITVKVDAITGQIDAIKARIDNEMVTRADLKNFATKDDLKNFATKDDLKNFATKDDLKNFATKDDLENFVTKLELAELRTEMVEGFGALRVEMRECVAGLHRTIVLAMAGSFTAFAALLTALRIWG
ncbi:MAG: hypothetical protein OXC70_03630 [Gammaproteobacteria bacterium]|nr:hypothetical protein [Gammaproteobacteria bacterium]